MPKTLLTDLAEVKLAKAAASSNQVAITHIALGDGDGDKTYDPTHDQTKLKHERARRAIDSRSGQGANSWLIKAAFPADTPAFPVREIGFFDKDGDLIAIWAGEDVEPRQTGAIVYRVEHALTFSAVKDGLIIVDAKDDLPELNLGRIRALEADGSVVTRRLADDAVTTDKMADEAITTPKLADNAVGPGKIANDAVTRRGISRGAVGTDEIADKAVTNSKLGSYAVTESKLSSSLRSNLVQDVRLGARWQWIWGDTDDCIWREKTNYVMTAIYADEYSGDDDMVAGGRFRPIQKKINGYWYTVSQV